MIKLTFINVHIALPRSLSHCSLNETPDNDTPSVSGLRRELSTNNFQSENKRARAGRAAFLPDDDREDVVVEEEPALASSVAIETPSTPVAPRLTRAAARLLLPETPVTPSYQTNVEGRSGFK